jgi:hypothetical protein
VVCEREPVWIARAPAKQKLLNKNSELSASSSREPVDYLNEILPSLYLQSGAPCSTALS